MGGRLSKSKTLPAEVQHPILLPKTRLVKIFLLDFHHKHHHPGPSAMEALLYQSYYPVGCRQMVKSVCKHCMVCRKALAKTIIQFMGDLPGHRISPAWPFDYTGVDFAGPFDVKRGHTRKPVLVKAYACLFVCMSTKIVHIDCIEDLSTASFMLCFERFINRRGSHSTFTVTIVPTSLVLPELLELPPNCPMTCKTLQPKQQTCKLMVSLSILFLQGPPTVEAYGNLASVV